MERRIKIYKTPEEIEEFDRTFYQRLCMKEMLMSASLSQQKKFDVVNDERKEKRTTNTQFFSFIK